MTKKQIFLFSGVFLIALFTLLTACAPPSETETQAEPAQSQPALAVEALTVSEGTLITEIRGSGTISGIREALVVSQTQGIIEKVSFELGRLVSTDEVLVQVDSEIPRLNMEQAGEQLENARIDYQTKQNLLEKGGASRAEVLRARSALRGAEARYKQTQKAFEDCSITAPISGYIAEKQPTATIGNFLSPGMQVAKVVDLSTLRLQISVGEGVIGQIREGGQASVSIPAACEGQSYSAEIVAIAAGSDPGTGSYPVVLEFENQCGTAVKSGMSAAATIIPATAAEHLIIPASAIARRNSEDVVFVADNGKARVQPIQAGRRIGTRIEGLEGLQAGDILIISGITSLSEGDPIAPTIVGESGSRR